MLSGLNTTRFTISVIVLFVFTYIFHTLVHGGILPLSGLTTSGDASVVIVHQLLLSVLLGYIFTLKFEGKGIGEGVRFGVIFGLLIGSVLLGGLDVLSLSGVIGVFVTTILYGIVGGVLLSLTYKK